LARHRLLIGTGVSSLTGVKVDSGPQRPSKILGRSLREARDHAVIGGEAASALVIVLIFVLAGCAAGRPMTACPDPDPDPISPCATSHSKTYGGI
jgi:hypothetical protein